MEGPPTRDPRGSSAATVHAFIERVRAVRWLAPDAAMDALDETARAWIDERVDEHLAAASRYTSHGPFEARVECTRGFGDAAVRWEAAWASAPPSTPYLAALDRAAQPFDGPGDDGRRFAWAQQAMRLAREAAPPCAAWAAMHGFGEVHDALPGVTCAALHAGWLALFDDDPEVPSPWEPLFALWERGLWPLAMPDASMLVYVPHVANGRLVAPTGLALPLPRRSPQPAGWSSPMPRLRALGCGPGPSLEALEPGPPDMPLGGAPMPVQPFPVVQPLMPNPPPPAREPWYKRLFRPRR